LPTFVSDVAQQFMEYVGETNREKVHNRRIAYAFSRPIIDPTGSQDPFYYHIEKFYGSSDHVVFGQAGVPFIFFNHWPDAVYHSSQDRPRSLDPTQLKRTAFIGVATAAILAGAGAADVGKLAALTAGYASERVGRQVREGIQQMAAAGPSELFAAYREARNAVEQAYLRERAAIRSASSVAKGDRRAASVAEAVADRFYRGLNNDLARIDEAYRVIAEAHGVPLAKASMSAAEREASRLYPRLVYEGVLRPTSARSDKLRGFHAQEALWFADGTRSVLEIRNAISAELGPVPVEDVRAFFEDAASQGSIELRRRQRGASGNPLAGAEAPPGRARARVSFEQALALFVARSEPLRTARRREPPRSVALDRQTHALAVVALERFDLGPGAGAAQDVEQRADGRQVEEVVGHDQFVLLSTEREDVEAPRHAGRADAHAHVGGAGGHDLGDGEVAGGTRVVARDRGRIDLRRRKRFIQQHAAAGALLAVDEADARAREVGRAADPGRVARTEQESLLPDGEGDARAGERDDLPDPAGVPFARHGVPQVRTHDVRLAARQRRERADAGPLRPGDLDPPFAPQRLHHDAESGVAAHHDQLRRRRGIRQQADCDRFAIDQSGDHAVRGWRGAVRLVHRMGDPAARDGGEADPAAWSGG